MSRSMVPSKTSLLGASSRAALTGPGWLAPGTSLGRCRQITRVDCDLIGQNGGGKDEHFAHQVGIFLTAADETNYLTTRRSLNDFLKALAHGLLKLQAL